MGNPTALLGLTLGDQVKDFEWQEIQNVSTYTCCSILIFTCHMRDFVS